MTSKDVYFGNAKNLRNQRKTKHNGVSSLKRMKTEAKTTYRRDLAGDVGRENTDAACKKTRPEHCHERKQTYFANLGEKRTSKDAVGLRKRPYLRLWCSRGVKKGRRRSWGGGRFDKSVL